MISKVVMLAVVKYINKKCKQTNTKMCIRPFQSIFRHKFPPNQFLFSPFRHFYCPRTSYSTNRGLTKSKNADSAVSTDLKTTVKETTKTATYGGVILLGIGITGALCYAIFRELLSERSPNNVYAKALDRCIEDDRLKLSLGEPIKGFGEETRRGRRRHVSHLAYSKDGVDHLRMKFYIKGSRRKATVHLEVRDDENKRYMYRYLFVQLDDYPYTTFILEDNRHLDPDKLNNDNLPELNRNLI